jgi:predicted DNA-binding antitoxin AbrB/MazE fold protein
MSAPIEAIYEKGVFRPLDSVDLPEGKRVSLTVISIGEKCPDPASDLLSIAEDTGVSDLATNIDHYLYGLPKHADE